MAGMWSSIQQTDLYDITLIVDKELPSQLRAPRLSQQWNFMKLAFTVPRP